jgi:hypothetical protein
MAEILLGVLAQQLAFMATDGALNNNLGSGGGYGIHIRWSHTLTLLANCVRCNMNRHMVLVFTIYSGISRNSPLNEYPPIITE